MPINPLHLIDRAAGSWLNWRTGQAFRRLSQQPELIELKATPGELGMVMSHPGIAVLADDASALLDGFNASNYLEFTLMPRVDRNVGPVVVTIQRRSGKTPGELVAEMKHSIAELSLEADRVSTAVHGQVGPAVGLLQFLARSINDLAAKYPIIAPPPDPTP